MKKVWCNQKDILLNKDGKYSHDRIVPRMVRCPCCNKRLKTFIRNCVGDLSFSQACCWWEYMPKHKVIVKKKKGNRTHVGLRTRR